MFRHWSHHLQFWNASWKSFSVRVSSAVCDLAWTSSAVSNRNHFSFSLIFVNRKKSQGAISGVCGGWGMGDGSNLVFHQKLLGEDGSMRWSIMVKQPGLFFPKFGLTSFLIFMQSPQNFAVESGIRSLACWDRGFALPQMLYRWWHQSGIFWTIAYLSVLIKDLAR
jgi:hypothetical protein